MNIALKLQNHGFAMVLMTLAAIMAIPSASPPPASAQDFGNLQVPQDGGFGDPGFGFGDPGAAQQVTLWADYKVDPKAGEIEVSLHADVIDGWHIFSLTQASGGPIRSEIELKAPADAELVRGWEPESDPEKHFDAEVFNMEIEEHRGRVTWKARYRVPADADFENLLAEIHYVGQTCTDGLGQCINLDETVAVQYEGVIESNEVVTDYQPDGAHVKFSGYVNAQQVEPGQIIQLVIVAEPIAPYHIYARKNKKVSGSISAPTLMALTKKNGWGISEPRESDPPKSEETGIKNEPIIEYHEETVSWTMEVQIPKDAEQGEYQLAGLIGFQTCNESTCDLPMAAKFTGQVKIGDNVINDKSPLGFVDFAPEGEDAYTVVAKEAESMEWGIDKEPGSEPVTLSKFASWMFTAFLAGLILNVMPCVLPVIGLKVLSLVSQAGSHRFQIFFLNLWLAIGVMFVFLTLATMAVVFGLAWGEQFSNHWFTISLISVVFIFGLSFVGVWEIPIPGFAGSAEANKLTEREGAIGAFFKGVLSTILATPCAGPMLVPATAWAVAQPPVITYSMFAAMGLGMASPYLVIGLFPSAIKLLPKPGNWMVTFKEVMGFVMIGTAVWLFSTLADGYQVPMAAFAVFLAFACWLIGRIPAGSEKIATAKGWAFALGWLAVGGWISLVALAPGFNKHELEWQTFDRVAIADEVSKGNTVFVDFTADW